MVDAESEARIAEAVAEFVSPQGKGGRAAGRTCLIVAHRLSTVLAADQIVVMDEGRIIDRGKHAQLLTAGEEIAYIAVEKPLVSLSPDSVVLTNKRFILYRPKLFGRVEFEDYIWRDLHSAELVEGVINSRFLVQTTEGLTLTVENLPKVQARKIYAFAQQMEEFVREERRVREMEEKRASAGGINIGAAGAAAAAGRPGLGGGCRAGSAQVC